jgi:C-terminal processing protease CtpA/Prc
MKKIFLLNSVIILLFSSCIEQPEMRKNDKRGNFDALWEIVDTKYCYLTYKQIDWKRVYVDYLNELETIDDDDDIALFNLFGNMLAELKDGHVNLYSNFDISRYWSWYTDYPSNFNSSIVYSEKYLGRDYRIAGGMHYKKIADGKVGYVYYSSFSNTFSDSNVFHIFKEFSDCAGLIIDVRNNGGGYLSQSELLASYFFKEKTHTGYISHKTGNGHDDFSAPEKTYTSPHEKVNWQHNVVVLANRKSYSATNDFVCRMKKSPYAAIMGDKTGGGGGMPLSSELPNGWMVRFSACPMFDAEMNHTEFGIEPDIYVNMDESDLENDAIIEEAVNYFLY